MTPGFVLLVFKSLRVLRVRRESDAPGEGRLHLKDRISCWAVRALSWTARWFARNPVSRCAVCQCRIYRGSCTVIGWAERCLFAEVAFRSKLHRMLLGAIWLQFACIGIETVGKNVGTRGTRFAAYGYEALSWHGGS